jgi:hypothetical protein
MDVDDKIRFVLSTVEPMASYTRRHITGVLTVEDEGSTGRHVGSAMRLSLDGRRRLVTAARVIERARRGGRFAIGAGDGQVPFELRGAPDLFDEGLDIAAYFLPPDYPADDVSFWPDERVDTGEERLATDYLFVHGFPGVRAHFSPGLGGLIKSSLPYGVMLRDEDLPASMAPYQFALDFDPANMLSPDGRPAEWLDPRGLSGSPVWRIGASGQKVDAWKPELSLLVGVVTTWLPDEKLLLATKAGPLLARLRG